MRTAMGLAGCAAMFFVVSGGGRMVDGRMYSLDDGSIMPMQIEVTMGHGKMNAVNPKTGEKFEGTYAGVRQGQTTTVGGAVGGTPVSAYGQTHANVADATATLIGDRG